jgi:type IV pilus assembly protein PilA
VRHPRKEFRGFTLIELMIIVSILGVLASVAIPAYLTYIKRSKTSEVSLNIKNVFMGAVSYFDGEHSGTQTGVTYTHFLPETISFTPADPAAGSKFSIISHAVDFADSTGWTALGFAPNENFYYQYEWANADCAGAQCQEGDQVTAGAQGNLDSDSIFSYFSRVGTVMSGQLTGGPLLKEAELE